MSLALGSDMLLQFPTEVSGTPVGGTLLDFIDNWRLISNDLWVFSVVAHGHTIVFHESPPFRRTPIRVPLLGGTDKKALVLQHVSLLLKKRVLDPTSLGFYSWFFVVPKEPGSWRSIQDLFHLNTYVTKRELQDGDGRKSISCWGKVNG